MQEKTWTPGNTPDVKPPSKPLRPLTRKQQAFVRHLIDNPKDSATKAIQVTYGQKHAINPITAASMGTENLRKPNVLSELVKYSGNAENVVIQALLASKKVYKQDRDSGNWQLVGEEDDHAIRLRAADSLLDRIHGKATQRTEVRSEAVVIQVDLTSINEN